MCALTCRGGRLISSKHAAAKASSRPPRDRAARVDALALGLLTPPDGIHTSPGSRRVPRAQRGKARHLRLRSSTIPNRFLKSRSIGVATQQAYRRAVAELTRWCKNRKLCLSIARCHILQFDGFLRPSEALGLTWDSVFPPRKGSTANQCWAIIVRPNDTVAEGSNTDLAAAARQVPRAPPAKTGVHDNTVLFGEAASVKAGRWLIVPLLRRWYSTRGRRTHLFSLTLSRYEALLNQASRALKLHALKLCAHSARHGGASVDSLLDVRSITQVQARGCWDSPKSVARYRKPGTYARQVSLILEALMRGHAATLAALTTLLS